MRGRPPPPRVLCRAGRLLTCTTCHGGEREQVETARAVCSPSTLPTSPDHARATADTVRGKREGEAGSCEPCRRGPTAPRSTRCYQVTTAKRPRIESRRPRRARGFVSTSRRRACARSEEVGGSLGGRKSRGAWATPVRRQGADLLAGEIVLRTRPFAADSATRRSSPRAQWSPRRSRHLDEKIAFANDQKSGRREARPLLPTHFVREFFDQLAAARVREFVADAPEPRSV